jgi:hypothetical protein
MTTPSDVLSDSPVAAAVCEAPGCGRALSPAQLARGARACSAACRARAHRARREALREANLRESVRRERRAAVLGTIDRMAGELARLRAEVEAW